MVFSQNIGFILAEYENKHSIFKQIQSRGKNKSLLDFASLILLIKRFYEIENIQLDEDSISQKPVRKKVAKKLEKLLMHRDFVLEVCKNNSLRKSAEIISRKLKFSVSHQYLNTFCKGVRNGEF